MRGKSTSPLPGSGFTVTSSLHDFRPNGAKTKSGFRPVLRRSFGKMGIPIDSLSLKPILGAYGRGQFNLCLFTGDFVLFILLDLCTFDSCGCFSVLLLSPGASPWSESL